MAFRRRSSVLTPKIAQIRRVSACRGYFIGAPCFVGFRGKFQGVLRFAVFVVAWRTVSAVPAVAVSASVRRRACRVAFGVAAFRRRRRFFRGVALSAQNRRNFARCRRRRVIYRKKKKPPFFGRFWRSFRLVYEKGARRKACARCFISFLLALSMFYNAHPLRVVVF